MKTFLTGTLALAAFTTPLALACPAEAVAPGVSIASSASTVTVGQSVTLKTANAETSSTVARGATSFDRKYLIKTSHWVIQDMTTINHRLDDGIGVSSAFYLLSDSYGYMLHAGVPPKIVKKAKYRARISTLSDFAGLAGDEYGDDTTSALARYDVIRNQTRILFRQINAAIGTSLSVPPMN